MISMNFHKRTILLLTVCALFFFLCVINFISVFEDAFISFRYAEHLAEGHGLVFNPGERVWGYSNFLWTLLLALCVKLHLPIILSSKCLGVLCTMILIAWFVFRWPEESEHQNLLLILSGPLLISTSTHLMIASQNGMETLLFTTLCFGGVLSVIACVEKEKPFPLYAILFLLASLTRPEGPLFMIVATGIEILIFLKRGDRRILRRICQGILLFAVPYIIYSLSMYAWYGFPLPNSFYVKVRFDSYSPLLKGLKYVTSFFLDIRAYILLAPALFGLFDKTRRARNYILSAYILSYLIFVISVGGDFQVYFYRFIIPVLPLLFLMVTNGLSAIRDRLTEACPKKAGMIFPLIGVIILITNFLGVRSPVIPFFSPEADRSPLVRDNLGVLYEHPGNFGAMLLSWFSEENSDINPMGMVGQALDKRIEKGKTLATGQCGQIPFYLRGRPVVDMLGLMDNHVAHKRGFTLDYLKKRDIDHFILYYNDAHHHYYLPKTLFPHIIFTPYFQNHYFLSHVFRHKSILTSRNLKSVAYMLLFSKKEHPSNNTEVDNNLKEQIQACILSGHITELESRK